MIRAEIREKAKFLAEPISWALALMGCLWMAFRLSETANWIIIGVFLIGACIAATGFWIAINRLKLHPTGTRKGIVLIDERRVGFFDPDHEGGFVDFDALMRLEVRGVRGDRSWILYHEDGPPLAISQNAPGAEQLIDTFSALSGLSLVRITQVFETEGDAPEVLWERTDRTAPKDRMLH